MKLSVNESKLTCLEIAYYSIGFDFKICLWARKVTGPFERALKIKTSVLDGVRDQRMRKRLQISSAGHLVKSMRRRHKIILGLGIMFLSRWQIRIFARQILLTVRTGGEGNTWRFAGSNFLGRLLSSSAIVLLASQLLAPFKMVKRFLPCVMVNTKDLLFLYCPWCFSSVLGSDYHKENSLVDVVFCLLH